MRLNNRSLALLFGLLVGLAGILWLTLWRERLAVLLSSQSRSIMGTETNLRVMVRASESARGRQALQAATDALESVESLCSVHRGDTELAVFNASPAARLVPLSPATIALLRFSEAISGRTEGAFNPTCRPVLRLWKVCEEEQRFPSTEELRKARLLSAWKWVKLHAQGAEKLREGVEIDLGAVAKGYAVDLAIAAMQRAGASGGLVQCGGETRVFGQSPQRGGWKIAVRDPSQGRGATFAWSLSLDSGAVSTSGDYERYYEIRGQRLSHILDPRTGRPVETPVQATVIAESSAIADAWSTALSILGPTGLDLLQNEPGVEAMLILGGQDARRFQTPGFLRRVGQ
jgi:FAD:protein FMN transferase